MLQLKRIIKNYVMGSEIVSALKGVDLNFRQSEFVCILGQSGCGKTTLLNIIGGLDRYNNGDLIINGRSTKNYTDRDWDTYRNHSVGFVFQSYNLIPHQTVLQNVELALTLSGVKKSERRRRAKEAIKAVGLESQLNKRPSEMSGGQMQRVAIARAIVNDPDIILADEPTGALDSETSVQVMEILKEISKQRLVLMVTHNPELADIYATRTVKMLDGVIVSDSDPVSDEEIIKETPEDKKIKIKKPSMSPFTSFGLSLRNLITKKGRTLLTSFAGSIGIIGIALIFAVSQGMRNYISMVQENTLSSYPITLEAQHISIGTLMETFISAANSDRDHKNDAIYQKPVLYDLVNTLSKLEAKQNDLKSFKKYIEANMSSEDFKKYDDAINGIQYTYNIQLPIYTKNVDGKIIKSDTEKLIRDMLIKYIGKINGSMGGGDTGMLSMLSGSSSNPMTTLWQEMLPAKDGSPINPLIEKQYDLIYGSWPNSYNEILVVVDEKNEIDDMTLYSLGLLSDEEIDKIVNAAVDGASVDFVTSKWSYEEICDMEFRTILNGNCFREVNGLYEDQSENQSSLDILYANAVPLKVTGIIKLNEDATTNMLQGTLCYTHMLTEYIIEQNKTTNSIVAQLQNPGTDIFTGLPFADTEGKIDITTKADAFKDHIKNLDTAGKAEIFVKIMSIPDPNWVNKQVEQQLSMFTIEQMKEQIINYVMQQSTAVTEEDIRGYIESMTDDEIKKLVSDNIKKQIENAYAQGVENNFSSMSSDQVAQMLDEALPTYTNQQCASYYDQVLEFSPSTYEDNLIKLGYVELEQPLSINLYASSFANKDTIEELINNYNKKVDKISRIEYTDYMGIMMSSITTIIDAITYVLAAFVSVSLIVSSIMIGVITLISVQERTKEIGILRAIGASKKNVCGMFNAETIIIGLISGLIGVGFTYLICIPINAILYALTGIPGLKAYLPPDVAIALVTISFVLTLISGLIPSRSAAKKDPVIALRTE